MKFLCVGDMHLGRQPSRLSKAVVDGLNPATELPGPALAWKKVVAKAVNMGCEAVLLVGDVVEQEDDFFEAYSELRRGVERLAEAGIRVIAVAGNHDVKVLPRLAETVEGFQMLGRSGQWESTVVQSADGRQVRVVGWSFPDLEVTESPLHRLELSFKDALPTLGLLHCDRDNAGSRHAPVRSSDLFASPVDAWLLGHIHKPDTMHGPRPIGYLGSLTGLDPGEPGVHGPWELVIEPAGGITMEHVPLAPLRWEEVDVSVEGLAEPRDIQQRIISALSKVHESIKTSTYLPDVVGCRLRITGRTRFRTELERILSAEDPRDLLECFDTVLYFVHQWHIETAPAIDLAELASTGDLVGLLAQKVLQLQALETIGQNPPFLDEAQRRLAQATSEGYFRMLGRAQPDANTTAKFLEFAALRAIDQLLRQREERA